MFETIVEPLSKYLHHHPTHGGIITCIIAFAESLAIVGSIIPGSVTMTMIGVLVGLAILPFKATFAWAIAGAIMGDFASYYFGIYYQSHVRQFGFMVRYKHWIERGEHFIEKHGAKSIIIGRFFGPMRSMIPMIAGLLRMKPLHFTCAAIPSAIFWAILYLTPGIMIGAFSLEIPRQLTMHFLMLVLVLIIGGGMLFGIMKYGLPRIQKTVNNLAQRLWHHLNDIGLSKALAQHDTLGQAQVIRLAKCLLMLGAFVLIACQVVTQGILTTLNAPLYHLLQSIHHHSLTTVMLTISLTDNRYVLLVASLAAASWCYYQEDRRAAWYWLVLAGSTAVLIHGLKMVFDVPRPPIVRHADLSASFPSGHVVLCAAVANFFAAQLSPMVAQKHRYRVWHTTLLCVIAIMISRIYLGAHWLTDVLGGVALGLTVSYALQILYFRRQKPSRPRPRQAHTLIIVCVIAFSFAWISYGLFKFDEKMQLFTYQPPSQQISHSDWWQHVDSLPTLRNNRLGHPNYALNVQLAGKPAQLQQTLLRHGWQSHQPQASFWHRLQHLIDEPSLEVMPIFPQLHHMASPILVLSKSTTDQTVIIKLWDTHTQLDAGNKLYVGTIYTHAPPETRLTEAQSFEQHRFFNHLKMLRQNLHQHLTVIIRSKLQPNFDYWDGKVIQIDLTPM